MKKRRDTPWHKWRFTLGGCWLLLLFGYMAWSALSDADARPTVRILVVAFAGGVAVLFAVLEWRNRKPTRANTGSDKADEGT